MYIYLYISIDLILYTFDLAQLIVLGCEIVSQIAEEIEVRGAVRVVHGGRRNRSGRRLLLLLAVLLLLLQVMGTDTVASLLLLLVLQ